MWGEIRFGALLAFAACCAPGCAATDEDTGEEEVEGIGLGMGAHDGAPSLGTIDEACEEACRALLSACIDACRTQRKEDRPACVGSCSSGYGECVRDCGYGGGCRGHGFGWRCW